MGRRFVLRDSISGLKELKARYRSFGRSQTVHLNHRPNMSVGDLVFAQLGIRSTGTLLELNGAVRRSTCFFAYGSESRLSFELALDGDSGLRLSQWLEDGAAALEAKRHDNRLQSSAWSHCRLASSGELRSARIVDISSTGLFLSTGLDAREDSTVLFKPQQAKTWLAGRVAWRGHKDDQPGLGLNLVFSRPEERWSWNEWLVRQAAG